MRRRPKMPPAARWTRFRPSLCNGCWANCCSGWPVEVSVSDLIRLELLPRHAFEADLDGAIATLLKRRAIKRKRGEPLVFVLPQTKQGDCVFLNQQRQCSVYDKRPQICRRFPRIGARPNFCPHVPR